MKLNLTRPAKPRCGLIYSALDDKNFTNSSNTLLGLAPCVSPYNKARKMGVFMHGKVRPKSPRLVGADCIVSHAVRLRGNDFLRHGAGSHGAAGRAGLGSLCRVLHRLLRASPECLSLVERPTTKPARMAGGLAIIWSASKNPSRKFGAISGAFLPIHLAPDNLETAPSFCYDQSGAQSSQIRGSDAA